MGDKMEEKQATEEKKEELDNKKGVLDKFVSKIISRKFLVWCVATILMLISGFSKFTVLRSQDWVIISAIYIGGQTVIDAVKAFSGPVTPTMSIVQSTLSATTKTSDKKDDKGKENEKNKEIKENLGGVQ